MAHVHGDPGHDHAHGHAHDHAVTAASAARLAPALVLTLVFVAIEAGAGWFAHSLALMSDAGHNLADAAALGLSWYAIWIARRPAHAGMTFGYHRVGILAALVNSVTLVVISLVIFWEGINRLQNPIAVHSTVMIGVAAIAFVLNLLISIWLHSGRHDLNVRSAYLHMLGDALASLGVVGAGIVVAKTGSSLADPIASLLIAALILGSSWGILRESVTVLLEGTPAGLDMGHVEQTIRTVEGVVDVHDLHVWTISSGLVACSCHVLIDTTRARAGQQVLHNVTTALGQHFGIWHATIQVEVDSCESTDMYCDLTTGRPARLPSTH